MAEFEANEAMEMALYKNGIEKNNVIAQLAWLNNRMPDRWVDRRSVVVITDQALEAEAVTLRRRLAELEGGPYEQLPAAAEPTDEELVETDGEEVDDGLEK